MFQKQKAKVPVLYKCSKTKAKNRLFCATVPEPKEKFPILVQMFPKSKKYIILQQLAQN
jgi:hypothetical protein